MKFSRRIAAAAVAAAAVATVALGASSAQADSTPTNVAADSAWLVQPLPTDGPVQSDPIYHTDDSAW